MIPGSSHVLELTGLQFGDVGAAAHVIRALLADGDAAKVDGGTSVIGSGTDQGRGDHGGAGIGMSVRMAQRYVAMLSMPASSATAKDERAGVVHDLGRCANLPAFEVPERLCC